MSQSTVPQAQFKGRVARFADLTPMDAQRSATMPQAVADIIWSRRLLPVIGLEGIATPFGRSAPIIGAKGITITYAECPAGTGPSLHRHLNTVETFTVIKGRFEFRCGPTGAEHIEMGPLDVVSVPPMVYRSFRNISAEDGILQVVISGGVHDMNDIEFPAATAEEIRAHGESLLEYFKATGLKFVD